MKSSKSAITQRDLMHLHKTITNSSFDNLIGPELACDLEYITKRLEEHKQVLISQLNELSISCNEITDKIQTDLRNVKERLASEYPLRDGVTLFEPLGLSGREVPLTKALAWLLDPDNNHGFDHKVVEYIVEFLNKVPSNTKKIPTDITKCEVKSEYPIESGRLDIQITIRGKGSPHVIVIEAKVNAKGREDRQLQNQLDKYRKKLDGKNRTFVFLSPRGAPEPKKPKNWIPNWIPISYLDLAKVLLRAYDDKDINLRDKPGAPFLTLLIRSLIKDIEEINLESDLMLLALLREFRLHGGTNEQIRSK